MGAKRSGSARERRKEAPGGRGLSKAWTWAALAGIMVAFGIFVFEPVWRPAFSPPPTPEALTAMGAAVYQQHCAACHGPQAQGQVAGQPNGGQRADGTYIAPALNGTAHAWHHPPDQLFRIVKHGSPAADSPMKGLGDRLSDREIEAVLAYIQSLWPDRLRARYRSMHNLG